MIDIINLPYPMFVTTPEEKELLRKVELTIVDIPLNTWFGICHQLGRLLNRSNDDSIYTLKNKITRNIVPACYLHHYMFIRSSALKAHYYSLDFVDKIILERYIRLVWINKLLNYTGE